MARVIVAGTFDPAFARNRKLLDLLRRAGHEVVCCQVDLWVGERYVVATQGKLASLARALVAYPRLIWRFVRVPRGDLVYVMYPGWFDMIVLAPIARLRRMPAVFDIFISLYDTVVSDRGLASPRSFLGRACKLVDRLSLRAADRVTADTPSHADFFAQYGGVDRERIGVVWLGAQDDVFAPRPDVAPVPRRVMFHGTFIGLQGLPTIIRAAKLLEGDGIHFRLIGAGQELDDVQRLVDELDVTNLELCGLLPLERIPEEIAAAQVCLGIFGTSSKARRVVPNKLYECVAVGRPVISGNTSALRAAFTEHEVAGSEPGDPEALAAELRALVADDDRRESLARAAHERYCREYSTEALTHRLDEEVQAALGVRPR